MVLDGEPRRRDPKPALFASFEDLPDLAVSQFDALGNRTGSWRSQKPEYRFKIAPCNALCPAGNDVRGFLEALAKGSGPQRAVIALGYAGWGDGQLESEMRQNAWLSVPADKDIVFESALQSRWEKAVGKLGISINDLHGVGGYA